MLNRAIVTAASLRITQRRLFSERDSWPWRIREKRHGLRARPYLLPCDTAWLWYRWRQLSAGRKPFYTSICLSHLTDLRCPPSRSPIGTAAPFTAYLQLCSPCL